MRAFAVGILVLMYGADAVAGQAYELLSAQPEAKRHALFARVVGSAGHACPSVSQSIYMGESTAEGKGFWTVRCGDADYIIAVSNDGNMQTNVLSCAVAAAVNVKCWTPF